MAHVFSKNNTSSNTHIGMIKCNLPAISCILLFACTYQPKDTPTNTDNVHHHLQQLSDSITIAEVNDDLTGFLRYYDGNAISMPEYQPTLTGISQVQSYYKEIFHRQNIKTFKRTHDEFIDMDSTIIEVGDFHKEFTMLSRDSVITQDGKYFFVWKKSPEGKFKIAAETFGFFHRIDNPETLIVRELMPKEPEAYHDEEIPFELRAYNALMEKYVARSGSGALRSEFFTDDGKFFPFEHPTVSGINEIKPYLVRYDAHGNGFKFDTISVWTFGYMYQGDYVLEYPRFFVRWSAPGATGGASGKGIRIWKRQQDHSLKLYREIGTHNLD